MGIDIYFQDGTKKNYTTFEEITCLCNYNDIIKLYCNHNQLTELPKLPDSLTCLYCSYNQLKELPELPDNLEILYCYNNQLTELPKLPDSITRLTCYHNPIYDFLKSYFNKNDEIKNINEYREWKLNYQKKFILKIENWFLECKGNPEYDYCRKIINTMYEEDYPE